MAYYSIAFSVSHIFAHNTGLQLIDKIGFDNTWSIMTGLSVMGAFALLILMRVIKKEKNELKSSNPALS